MSELTYTRSGDYLIPDLSLTEQPQAPLGKYGRMRKDYLKEHRPVLWNSLLLSERLYPHLREIDEAANNRLEQMMPELMKSAGVTEALKASDPMKWVGLMNTLKAQAEETILTELVFDAPAGAQMSFFPSEAEQIQSIAEAESVTPSAFSMFISQDDIDHILRTGGNADAARMKIAAEFSKQKPLEDRAAFLKALYYGGNGLITDNGRLSAWYGDDGIHIATGDTSRYLRSAQVIGWADAAERIEELLDGGAFATNLEVTEAPRYERLGIAVDVWNLYHDFSDEAKSLGYLSCLGNIHSTSFPEETERLTDDLLNPAFRDRLLSEYKVFMDAYRENRALLRFHYHRPQTLLTRLEELSLPRKKFRSDMEAIPETGRFITEDEIAASLANGSSFEGGKTRIYAFFQTSHTPKENADFLKKEYGIGGHTHLCLCL